jgi:S1-C subfamily serine protease
MRTSGMRAFAGADLTDIEGDLGEYFGAKEGVLVLRVPDGTPAERAGLEAGDVITKVDGRNVASVKDLRSTAENVGPRVPIKLTVLRHGKSVNLELRRN